MSKDNQIRRYSIRKLSIGTASVLIGLAFVSGNNHIVHADELGNTDKASENSNQQQSSDSQKQAQVIQHIDTNAQNSQNNLANNSQNEQVSTAQNSQQVNASETAKPVNKASQTVSQARAELNKASLNKSANASSLEKSGESVQAAQAKNANVNTASQAITVQKPTANISENSFKQSLAVNTADNADANKSVDDANKKVQQDIGDSGVVSGDDTVHKSGTIKYQDENGNQLHDDTKTDVDYVPYYKKAQGVISYVDGDTGQTLAIDNLYGYVGGKITIDQSTLEKYINQGYMVSRDDSLNKRYDQDNNQNSFTITLAHQKSTDPGTAVSSTTIATNYVVEFVDEDGNPLATPYVQSDKFVKDTDYTDQVTGKKHTGSGQWNMTRKEFDYVPAVSINGYIATKKELPGVTTAPDDPVKIGMIVYRKLGKFIPSYIIPGHPGVPDQIEPISGLSGTPYQTDPNDPSKLLKQQVLPTYDNYVADTDVDGNNVASGFYTVSDPYKDTPIIYKSISEVDPGAKPVTKDASLTIKYVDDQGHNLLPDDRQSYTFDSSQTDDNGNEITKHAFRSVTVPVIDGYIADQSRIKQPTVTKDKPNLTITVTYRKLGKIIPVDSVTGEPIQGAEQPQYENDEFDATKIRNNIVVPQVGGYVPNDATVTPLDPLKNLPVKYVKNADKGQITINFVDDATGGTIQSKTLSGVVGETALYDPQEDIDYVRAQGYELDQNTLPNMLVFSKSPQSYSIGFNHKTYEINSGDGVNYDDGDPIDPSSPNGAKANMQDMIRTYTYTVHFEGAGAATPKDIVQKVIWTRHYSIDEATGNVIVHGDWQHNLSGEEYDAVPAPVIQTYHAEVLQAPSVKVDMQNHEYTIKYKRNGRLRLRMVDQVGKELKVIKGPYYITSPNDPRKVLPDEKVPLYENFIPDVRKVTPNNPDKDEIVVYRHQPDMVIVPVPVPTPGAPQPTVADVLMYTAKQIGIMPSNPVIIATQKAINSGDLVFPYDAGEGAEVGTNVVKNWVHLMRRSAPYNNVQNGAESSEKDPDKVDDGTDSTDANGAIHVNVPKQPNVGFDLLKTRAADTRDTSNTSSSLVHTPRDIDNATFISHFGDDDYDTWDGKGDIIDGTVIKTSKQGDITDETYNKINNTEDVKDNKHYSDRDFSSWDEENWDTLHYKYQDPYDKDLHTGNYVNDKPANDKYYGLPGVSIPEAKTPVSHDYAADKNPDAQGHGKHDVDQVKKGAKKSSMLFTSFVAMPSQALNQSLAIMPGATFAKPMMLAAIDDDTDPYGTPYYAIVSDGKVIAKDLTKDQMQEYKVKHDLPKIDGYTADDGGSASTTYDTPDGKVTVITYHKDSGGKTSPDNPDNPGSPDQPGSSTDHGNTGDHGQQGGSTNPDNPSSPDQPGGSTDHGNTGDHGQQGGSTNPDQPGDTGDHGQQGGSTDPDNPSNPDQPGGSTDHGDTGDHGQQGGSTDTDNPGDHGQQGDSTNPDNTGNHEQQGGSTDHGDIGDHGEHSGSTDPDKPSNPDQTGDSTDHGDTDNPGQPGSSTDHGGSGNHGEHGGSTDPDKPNNPDQPGGSTDHGDTGNHGQQGGSTDSGNPSDHGQQGGSTDTDNPSDHGQHGDSTDSGNPSDSGQQSGSTVTDTPNNPGQQGSSTGSGQIGSSANPNHNETQTNPSYNFGKGQITINDINASQNGSGTSQNNNLNQNRNSISNSASSVNNRNSATAPVDHRNNRKSAKNTESNKRGTRSAISSNGYDRNHNIASNAITASGYRRINSAYSSNNYANSSDESGYSYGYDGSYANDYAEEASTINANQLSQSDNAFDNSNLNGASNSNGMGQLPQTNASANDAITALGFALISLASLGSFALRKRE